LSIVKRPPVEKKGEKKEYFLRVEIRRPAR